MEPDTSPVKAPLSSAQRSWAPSATPLPFSTRATSARYTKGGHSSTSAEARSGEACSTASASFTALSRLPFIFQLPATRRWRMWIPLKKRDPEGLSARALYWRGGWKSNAGGHLDTGGGPHGSGDVLGQGIHRLGLLPLHHHP